MGSSATVCASMTPKPSQRHLVLNMDINKTVMMMDSVSGKTTSHIVNETLCHAAWGEEVDGKWVPVVSKPSLRRPARTTESLDSRCSGLVSYAEWLEKAWPGVENKRARNASSGVFTESGQPGEFLKHYATEMLEPLHMPDGSELQILPSFFELLVWLKRERRSFTLCFRTFGEDLPEMARELNRFCEGRHPLFPDVRMDGSDGDIDYRLDSDSSQFVGTFHRDHDTISLILGTADQAGEGRHKLVKDRSLDFYRAMKGVQIFTGFDAVREVLDKLCARRGTIGLRDYYKFWKSQKMTSDGGKIFLYNPLRCTQQHELFFDDNIRFSDCFIVQPMNLSALHRKAWVIPLLQTHLCRAELLESIPDRQWFVKQVKRLEAGYESKLRARERIQLIMRSFLALKESGHLSSRLLDAPDSPKPGENFDVWAALRHSDDERCTAGDRYEPELFRQRTEADCTQLFRQRTEADCTESRTFSETL